MKNEARIFCISQNKKTNRWGKYKQRKQTRFPKKLKDYEGNDKVVLLSGGMFMVDTVLRNGLWNLHKYSQFQFNTVSFVYIKLITAHQAFQNISECIQFPGKNICFSI